jgi:hypothetical protein
MKKNETNLFFDKCMEQVIIHYIDDNNRWKIDYVKNFIRKNFQVEELDDSFIKIERLHSKSLMWLLVSLLIDYEAELENHSRQTSKQTEQGDSLAQNMKMPEESVRQEKYKSLEMADIFSVEEPTPQDVVFIEYILSKTNVDLEAKSKFVIGTSQMIYLVRKIMQEYKTFLANGEKFQE